MTGARDYIKKLKLQKHVEGGYFSETVRSLNNIIIHRDTGVETRSAGASILYLLEKDDFSTWHKVGSDEVWHFHDGSPMLLHVIYPKHLKTHLLGNPCLVDDAVWQVNIPAGFWFSAEVQDKTSFSLMGCTTFPAFEYRDLVIASREQLINEHPQYGEIIVRLTKHTSNELCEIN